LFLKLHPFRGLTLVGLYVTLTIQVIHWTTLVKPSSIDWC